MTLEETVYAIALIALLAMYCVLGAPLGAQAASPTSSRHANLASSDWSVRASPNLASNPPPEKAIVSFLNSVQTSVGAEPEIGEIDSDSEHLEYVCSFRFADLRHDGSL